MPVTMLKSRDSILICLYLAYTRIVIQTIPAAKACTGYILGKVGQPHDFCNNNNTIRIRILTWCKGYEAATTQTKEAGKSTCFGARFQ